METSNPNREAISLSRRSMLFGAGAAAALMVISPRSLAKGNEVILGIPLDSSNCLAFMVASAAGYFRDEGLNATVKIPSTGVNVRTMVVSGALAYAMADPVHPLASTAAGRPCKILMALDTRASIAMVVRQDLYDKGITSPEKLADLKKPDGSKPLIGVSRFGAQAWVYGERIMETTGKVNNVEFVSLGEGINQLDAFKAHRVDALMADVLVFLATQDQKLGTAVFNATDTATWLKVFKSEFPGIATFALASQVHDHPEETQKVINAVYRAQQRIKKESPAALVKLVKPPFLSGFKPAVLEREIGYLKPLFNYTGELTKQEFIDGGKVWFSKETKVKPLPYEEVVDMSFLNKARAKYG